MSLTSLKHRVFGRRFRSIVEAAPHEPAPPPLPTAVREPSGYHGYLNELSPLHAHGWIQDPKRPALRVSYELVLPESGEVLATGRADQFWFGLASAGIGDGAHAFWTRLARPLNEDEREHVVVRMTDTGQTLVRSPSMGTAYEPLLHVAMDIVDNCNLRCPFCLYDTGRRAQHIS